MAGFQSGVKHFKKAPLALHTVNASQVSKYSIQIEFVPGDDRGATMRLAGISDVFLHQLIGPVARLL